MTKKEKSVEIIINVKDKKAKISLLNLQILIYQLLIVMLQSQITMLAAQPTKD